MSMAAFKNREDAGSQLGARLAAVELRDPLVLAIPRGGIEVGAALAQMLGADLDVVLSRKIRAAEQPELALGAVSEDGEVYLNREAVAMTGADEEHIDRERHYQLAEIERRSRLFRSVRSRAPIAGRSVIITDDGLATGSTMIAALHTAGAQRPHELICAVPVAPPERLEDVRRLCDRVVCLLAPEQFWAVGPFYADFSQVSDERVVELLARHGTRGESRVSG